MTTVHCPACGRFIPPDLWRVLQIGVAAYAVFTHCHREQRVLLVEAPMVRTVAPVDVDRH